MSMGWSGWQACGVEKDKKKKRDQQSPGYIKRRHEVGPPSVTPGQARPSTQLPLVVLLSTHASPAPTVHGGFAERSRRAALGGPGCRQKAHCPTVLASRPPFYHRRRNSRTTTNGSLDHGSWTTRRAKTGHAQIPHSPISQAPALFVCLLRFAFRPRLLLLGYTEGRGRGGAMNALASAIGVPGRRSSAVDRTGCDLRSLPFRYERWCIGAQWTRCPAAHCTAVPLLLLLLSLHASVGTA